MHTGITGLWAEMATEQALTTLWVCWFELQTGDRPSPKRQADGQMEKKTLRTRLQSVTQSWKQVKRRPLAVYRMILQIFTPVYLQLVQILLNAVTKKRPDPPCSMICHYVGHLLCSPTHALPTPHAFIQDSQTVNQPGRGHEADRRGLLQPTQPGSGFPGRRVNGSSSPRPDLRWVQRWITKFLIFSADSLLRNTMRDYRVTNPDKIIHRVFTVSYFMFWVSMRSRKGSARVKQRFKASPPTHTPSWSHMASNLSKGATHIRKPQTLK